MRLHRSIYSTKRARALTLPGGVGDYISTPDSAATSFAGDFDLVFIATGTDWDNGGVQALIAKQGDIAGEYSYTFYLNGDGLFLFISTDGTAVSIANASDTPGGASKSMATVATNGQPLGIRATRASGTGSVDFYTSANFGVAWSAFGVAQSTTAGAVFNSVEPLEVGSRAGGTNNFAGDVHFAEVRSTIGGAGVAVMNPRASTRGRTSWTASTGEVWTVQGTASLS